MQIINGIVYEDDAEAQQVLDSIAAASEAFWQQEEEKAKLIAPLSPQEVLIQILASTDISDQISDEALSHMYPYFFEWQLNTDYFIKDIISYKEHTYRCLQDHTSREGWEPDVSVSLWAKILPGQDGGIGEWVQPDSTNPYMKGDKVTHNGITWESNIDYNVYEPGVYGWIQI